MTTLTALNTRGNYDKVISIFNNNKFADIVKYSADLLKTCFVSFLDQGKVVTVKANISGYYAGRVDDNDIVGDVDVLVHYNQKMADKIKAVIDSAFSGYLYSSCPDDDDDINDGTVVDYSRFDGLIAQCQTLKDIISDYLSAIPSDIYQIVNKPAIVPAVVPAVVAVSNDFAGYSPNKIGDKVTYTIKFGKCDSAVIADLAVLDKIGISTRRYQWAKLDNGSYIYWSDSSWGIDRYISDVGIYFKYGVKGGNI